MPATTEQTTATMDVARRLVALCREGKNLQAIEELYSDDIVSVEVCGTPEMPATMQGKDAIRGKNQWWVENHEVHGGSVTGPFPHGDRFAVLFAYDITPKVGPMSGQRMQMQEVALYEVRNGWIVHETFFYDLGDA